MLKMAVINEQTILDGYAYPNISLLGERIHFSRKYSKQYRSFFQWIGMLNPMRPI